MRDILGGLYHGHIHPEEDNQLINKEIMTLRRKYLQNQERFLSEMKDEALKAKLLDLLEEKNELFADEMEDCYVQGMRMGARMAMALLGEERI